MRTNLKKGPTNEYLVRLRISKNQNNLSLWSIPWLIMLKKSNLYKVQNSLVLAPFHKCLGPSPLKSFQIIHVRNKALKFKFHRAPKSYTKVIVLKHGNCSFYCHYYLHSLSIITNIILNLPFFVWNLWLQFHKEPWT